MGNTQVLCFLITFAEDVDPDKVLQRYPWSRFGGLDLEVKGFVKDAKGASSAPSVWHARVCLRQFFTMQLFCSSEIQSELCTEHHSRVHIGGQNGDAIRAVPANERAANTVHETCFRVLILCCIATPTGQLTRRLFYRLLHRLLQCLLLRLGHCGLCAASSCFTERCIHCLCVIAAAALLFASFIMLYSVL